MNIMKAIITLVLFYIYFLFIDYINKMIIFDFRKYVLKDKYLKDIRFSYNWVEKYAEKKAYEKFEEKQLLKITNNLENVEK